MFLPREESKMDFKMFDDDDWRRYLALIAAGIIIVPNVHHKDQPHLEVERPFYSNLMTNIVLATTSSDTGSFGSGGFHKVL